MNDKKLIIAGLIIFVFIFIFPFLYNLCGTTEAVDPVLSEKAQAAKFCVVSKEKMKVDHMQILDEWRDVVVRKGERVYVNSNGQALRRPVKSWWNWATVIRPAAFTNMHTAFKSDKP